MEGLFNYLRADVAGKQAHKVMTNDPARILDHVADDARIDGRDRENNLASMRRTLATRRSAWGRMRALMDFRRRTGKADEESRSEEHTSELQSLMRISYAVFCLKKIRA